MKKESRIFFSKFFIVVYLLAFLFAIYVFFAISCAIGIVDGNSMSPTLNNGDVFIYTKESQIHRLNVVAIITHMKYKMICVISEAVANCAAHNLRRRTTIG